MGRTTTRGGRFRILIAMAILAMPAFAADRDPAVFPHVADYFKQRQAEFDQIPIERRAQLERIAAYVRDRHQADSIARITFICTHNSRRSHFAQVWSAVAACHLGIDRVETFSGGTEATAMNPRTISALQRAGLNVHAMDTSGNPRIEVRYSKSAPPLVCFSKVYDLSPNPDSRYCGVLTCSQADRACPQVKGADERVAIPYDDPKRADGTPAESAEYDARSAQICREMLFVFSAVQRPGRTVEPQP